MKGEKDKVLKIMNELVCFFFSLGIKDSHIHIHSLDSHTTIIVEGKYDEPDFKKLERFNELISNSRQEDLEEYYWNLAGSTQYPEFILLGTLVDSSDIQYTDQTLTITVTRNHTG